MFSQNKVEIGKKKWADKSDIITDNMELLVCVCVCLSRCCGWVSRDCSFNANISSSVWVCGGSVWTSGRVNSTHIFMLEAALSLFLCSGTKLMCSLTSSADIKQIVYLCNLSEGVKFIYINIYIMNAHCRVTECLAGFSKSLINTITIFP